MNDKTIVDGIDVSECNTFQIYNVVAIMRSGMAK